MTFRKGEVERHTSKAQTDGFKSLLEVMAGQPQDYVSTTHGRITTKGFHELALMYRDKRTDLGHLHYVCKTKHVNLPQNKYS